MVRGRIDPIFFYSTMIVMLSCGGYDRSGEVSVSTEDLSSHIETLASDEFMGRAPSSEGEEKTIDYLKSEFESYGLQPGNGNSFFQEVPLVAITTNPGSRLTIAGNGQRSSYNFGPEYVAWTKRVVGSSSIRNSEMIFVGYGIVAPEYDWNDYEGLDVSGKTVIILVNDPGFATQDTGMFNGNSMTYYGRWTYKFEEAARQGAAGAIIIHNEAPAGYPWAVVEGGWSGPQFDLLADDNNMSRCPIEGWVTLEVAQSIFSQAGANLAELSASAARPGFKPVSLGINASLILNNDIKQSRSNNVIALLPGSVRPEEYIIYTAHWDHLGVDPNLDGDQIYNGAFDNATGTAGLLEIAEAFTMLKTKPERSLVFLAVTAEEQGLLGSKYYAENPIYPHAKTVAAINMDGLNVFGKMNDITVIGFGNSELDDYLVAAAKHQGRVVRPDPSPEKGYYYRSDHFSFAKAGIPALYTDEGTDHIVHGSEWTMARKNEYTTRRYHKPSDEYDPNWDLSGAVDDVKLLFRVGYDLANSSDFPNWREGNEFRARRDKDMNSRKER